ILENTVISLADDAGDSEKFSANELRDTLAKADWGKSLDILSPENAVKGGFNVFAVGAGASLFLGGDKVFEGDLGDEGYSITSVDKNILITGAEGAPRGALYGVYGFLRSLGFEWYSADDISTPTCPDHLGPYDTTFTPAYEYRDNNQDQVTQNEDFAVRIGNNRGNFDSAHGGTVKYAEPPGFVHTSYRLFGDNTTDGGKHPPTDLFKTNNEWFWPHDDGTAYGQLCCLVKYLKVQVKALLDANPDATIISVSQNDNGNYCNDTVEAAIIEEEGSPVGPMLRAINAIADSIKDDYPNVAVDTLAYQYTRAAPKITVPRDNVIIRLCSIECNFAQPLTDDSNKAFQQDIINWGKLSDRIYVWDYVTNFANYLAPFPNWRILGANVRFFRDNGVVGLFEEGSYQGPGGDMALLKDFVMNAAMMNPDIDDASLINEFLTNYFGSDVAPFVVTYMKTMEDSVDDTKFYMGESFGVTADFLTPAALLTSGQAFKDAAEVATGDFVQRLDTAKIVIHYVVLQRWDEIFAYAQYNGIKWPLEGTKEACFDEFERVYGEAGITHLTEGGGDIDWLRGIVFPRLSKA
ncbi:hypothetical protein TL16_g13243, partial [Triparma laevis f. inornata]